MQELTRDAGRHLVNAIAFGRLALGDDRKPAWASELREEHRSWWSHRNVVGIAVGRKVRTGKRMGLSLVVFVRRKLPKRRVPKGRAIPSHVRGAPLGIKSSIPTDVRQIGPCYANALVSVGRPAQVGFNVGHRFGGSGTIGCVVHDRSSGDALGLTCGHVLAPLPDSAQGDPVLVPSLEEARSQGVFGDSFFGTVARLVRAGFRDSDVEQNVDAATFRPDKAAELSSMIALLGAPPAGIRRQISTDVPVQKVGAASELTVGTTQHVNGIIWVSYPTSGGGEIKAGFENIIAVTRLSQPGDSGSLLLDTNRRAVGLVLGSTDELTICMPIQRALDAVQCDL